MYKFRDCASDGHITRCVQLTFMLITCRDISKFKSFLAPNALYMYTGTKLWNADYTMYAHFCTHTDRLALQVNLAFLVCIVSRG